MEGIDVLGCGLILGALVLWFAQRGHAKTTSNTLGALEPETERLLKAAFVLAFRHKAAHVEPAHIAAALATHPAVALELNRRGLSLNTITRTFGPCHDPEHLDPEHRIEWGPAFAQLIDNAYRHAKQRKRRTIDPTALWSAILTTDTAIASTLTDAGVQTPPTTTHPGSGWSFVYTWNDPSTPMEHVSKLLQDHFDLDPGAALTLMLSTHYNGFAAIGPYPLQDAEARIEAATEVTLSQGHALCVSLEAPDTHDWVFRDNGLLPLEQAA